LIGLNGKIIAINGVEHNNVELSWIIGR